MSASGLFFGTLLFFAFIASGGIFISIGRIVGILHDQYPEIWKRLGQPSGWGCGWKGCNRVDSLINGHALIADCLMRHPEWAPKDDNILEAVRRIRLFFWIFIASLVVSLPLGALFRQASKQPQKIKMNLTAFALAAFAFLVFGSATWLHHRFLRILKTNYPEAWQLFGSPTIMTESFVSFHMKLFCGFRRMKTYHGLVSPEARSCCERYKLPIAVSIFSEIVIVIAIVTYTAVGHFVRQALKPGQSNKKTQHPPASFRNSFCPSVKQKAKCPFSHNLLTYEHD